MINKFINFSKIEANNYFGYDFQLMNLTKNIDITMFLDSDITINKALRTINNGITPNTFAFKLVFENQTITIPSNTMLNKTWYFDNVAISDLYFDNPKIANWYFDVNQGASQTITINTIVEAKDEIELSIQKEGSKLVIFRGVLKQPKTTFKARDTQIIINCTSEDVSVRAYDDVFKQDEVLVDKFIYNSTSQYTKDNSLLYILAKKLGFTDADMDIEDIKYPSINGQDGGWIQVRFSRFTKEEQIAQELGEIVRSFYGTFTIIDGKLTIKSMLKPFIPLNYIFNEDNILNSFEKVPSEIQYDNVKVKFSDWYVGEEQLVWALVGTDKQATPDNAMVYIEPNMNEETQNKAIMIQWIGTGLVSSWNPTFEVEFVDKNGTKLEPKYNIELSNTGGKLKLFNSSSDRIFVNKFKIKGVPISEEPNISVHYNGRNLNPTRTNTIENKYVQSARHAMLLAQQTFHMECKSHTTYKYKANFAPFLEAGTSAFIRHSILGDYNVITQNITHNVNSTQVEAKEIKPFEYNDYRYEITYPTNTPQTGIIGGGSGGGTGGDGGIGNDSIPEAITDFTLKPMLNGFSVKIRYSYDTNNIKGYRLFINDGIQEEVVDISSNSHFEPAKGGQTYYVRVAAVSFRNIRGPISDSKQVIPLTDTDIGAGDIIYPPGQSPEELKEAYDRLNNQLNSDIGKLTNAIEGVDIKLDSKITAGLNGLNASISKVETENTEQERRITQNKTDIIATSNKISSTVSASITDLKENYLKQEFSKIEQNSNSIKLEVGETKSDISDLTAGMKPENIVSSINLSPREIKLNAQRIRLGNGLAVVGDNVSVKDLRADSLIIDSENFKVNTINGSLELNKITSSVGVDGVISIFGANNGLIVYDGTTEANSTMRTVIKAGRITYQEARI